jgi:hypothetical protein
MPQPHAIDGMGIRSENALSAFCQANGQILPPLVELIEHLPKRAVPSCSLAVPLTSSDSPLECLQLW